MKEVKPGDVRRQPSQRRGIEKIQRILDAATALLDEQGPGALTTSALAARAEISVGTVYHYFADREAIVAAIVARHLARATEMVERIAGDAIAGDSAAIIDRLLDAYIQFCRQEPGLRALWLTDEPAHHRHAVAETDVRLAETIARLLARSPDAAHVTAKQVLVSLNLTDSLLELAFRFDPAGDESTLAALRHLVHELFRYYERAGSG